VRKEIKISILIMSVVFNILCLRSIDSNENKILAYTNFQHTKDMSINRQDFDLINSLPPNISYDDMKFARQSIKSTYRYMAVIDATLIVSLIFLRTK